MHAYYSLIEGFVDGSYRKVGEPIGELTDDQSKYLVLNGHISKDKPVSQDAKSDAGNDVAEKASVKK